MTVPGQTYPPTCPRCGGPAEMSDLPGGLEFESKDFLLTSVGTGKRAAWLCPGCRLLGLPTTMPGSRPGTHQIIWLERRQGLT